MNLASSSVELAIFVGLFLLWIFLSPIEKKITSRDGGKTERRRDDRGSSVVIYVCVFVAIIAAFGLAGAGVTPLPDWAYGVGIFLMVFGFLVREWAVVTLKGYFSFRVSIFENQTVIDTGPYRWIRHPGYSGALLTLIGIGFAVQSLLGVVVLVILSSAAYGYRIRLEEAALLEGLGEQYSEYTRRTKRLIPFVL